MDRYEEGLIKRMFGYSRPDFKFVIIGVFAAMGNGLIFPIFSIFLAKMIGILIDLQLGEGNQSDANHQALIFFGLAIAGFFANFAQNAIFGVVGDRLTKRIRL